MLVIVSCSNFMPTPEPQLRTPLPPTMTPDPCGPETISDDNQMIRSLLNEFQEVAFIASNTPTETLISPVMRLEEIHKNLDSLLVPVCMQDLKQACSNYTASLVMHFSKLMNKSSLKSADIDLENSKLLWKIVDTEYEKVINIGRLEFQPLPSYENVFIPQLGLQVVAFNESEKTVNIRESPDLDSKVVALLESGGKVIIIGRTENGEWTRVKKESVYGWVFTEMITLNIPIDQIAIIE